MNPNIKINKANLDPLPVMTIAPPPKNDISLYSGDIEMLRIAEDGFYIRGIKLDQDDKEINEVYNCFKEWLTWSTLNRN
jgi:hypothetical protein